MGLSPTSLWFAHLFVVPTTVFAGQVSSSVGVPLQVERAECRRGAVDAVKVHRHAAGARYASLATSSCLSTGLASINALFCGQALFTAVPTRSV